jgi:hypothetical protein
MFLPLTEGLLVTTPFDDECRQLADRHYSRRTIGARQFCYFAGVSASGKHLLVKEL